MIGVCEAHELRLLRFARVAPVMQAHLEGDLDSGGAALRIEAARKTRRSDMDETFRQRHDGFVRKAGEQYVFQFSKLARDGGIDPRVGMPEQVNPPRTDAIEVAASLEILEPDAVPAPDRNGGVSLVVLHLRAGMPQDTEVARDQGRGIHFRHHIRYSGHGSSQPPACFPRPDVRFSPSARSVYTRIGYLQRDCPMVRTETPVCDFGRRAPPFSLPGVDGQVWTLDRARGPTGLLVMFICNHCPYVKAIRSRIIQDAIDLEALGIGSIAVMSNDPREYPEDSFEMMKQVARDLKFPFPYVWDETQEVAHAFGAVCTPDFFGYNADLALQYRGRLDESRKEVVPGARRDLFEAMKQVAETGRGPVQQIPSMGCSIKWKGVA